MEILWDSRKMLKLNTKMANVFNHTYEITNRFPNDSDLKFSQPRKTDITTWTEI